MMQNKLPYIIIITGSIGTGKSTAVNIIKKMGFKVLDSDRIVHDGYNVGKDIYELVIKNFGLNILNKDKTIDRQKLGKVVFSDENKLIKLNEIVHSYVVDTLIKGICNCEDNVIFLDIPLALEEKENLKRYGLIYDEIWLVYVNPQLQKERLRQRAIQENKNPEDVLKIIDKQIPIENKKYIVDEILANEGTVVDLENQIKDLIKRKNLVKG